MNMRTTFILTLLVFSITNCFSQVYEVKLRDDSLGFVCAPMFEGTEECEIVRADRDGTYKIYNYENDLIFVADIKDKKYNGQFEYYLKGKLEIKGQFSKGQRIGKWTYWDGFENISRELEYNLDTIITTYYKRDVIKDINCVKTEISVYQDTQEYQLLSEKTVYAKEKNLNHVRIVKNLNKILSNKWALTYNDYSDRLFGNNSLWFSLLTPKTEHKKGNEGVSLVLMDKKYREYIINHPNAGEHCYNCFEACLFETNSYFIYVRYFKNWYPDLIETLCNEIETFFKKNNNKL